MYSIVFCKYVLLLLLLCVLLNFKEAREREQSRAGGGESIIARTEESIANMLAGAGEEVPEVVGDETDGEGGGATMDPSQLGAIQAQAASQGFIPQKEGETMTQQQQVRMNIQL